MKVNLNLKKSKYYLGIQFLLISLTVLFLRLSLPDKKTEDRKTALSFSNQNISIQWLEYEAEQGKTNGTIIGPSRTYYTPEAEASGRRAVRLDATGKYVEIKSTKEANSIVIRYCIPDAQAGGGIKATLSLYINDKYVQNLNLTSKYAWIYGNFPWSNKPSDGKAHRFFDESHAFIGNIKEGDKIRLQKDAADTASYYIIDLIDLEKIPAALEMPENALSITSYGATANDTTDDTKALIDCIKDAQSKNKIVWIPTGNFNMNTMAIPIKNITIKGVGMWYSILSGMFTRFQGIGDSCKVSDLAMFGETDYRIDESPDNAFNGYFGKGSEIRNLWIEHVKCGFWIANYQNKTDITDGMVISGCRIRNTMADGVNYCRGTSNSIVEYSHLRNTGDDALATWSQDSMACKNIIFRHNLIQLPWLANCIALYGGIDHKIEYNTAADAVYSGGGINISSNFKPAPFGGTISVIGNTLIRCGSECYITPTIGAIWIFSKDSNIDAKLNIQDNNIYDASFSGISIHGPLHLINASLLNNNIDGAGTKGIYIEGNANGSTVIKDNIIQNSNSENFRNDAGQNFILN